MDTYSFRGEYALKDPRTKKILVQTSFSGIFLRASDGNILGDFDLGDDSHRYGVRGVLIPYKNVLILSAIAIREKPTDIREPHLELQFIKNGCLTDLLGLYGGGIRLASEEIIARLDEKKDPFPKGLQLWADNRSHRNSTIRLSRVTI